MLAKDRTGLLGEDIAARYLTGLGCRVLQRRWRTPTGELDLVVEDGPWIVAVEVKTRRGRDYGHPFEAVDGPKLRRLHRLLREYVQAQGSGGRDLHRVDVVSVLLQPRGRHPSTGPLVEHLRDVVA